MYNTKNSGAEVKCLHIGDLKSDKYKKSNVFGPCQIDHNAYILGRIQNQLNNKVIYRPNDCK